MTPLFKAKISRLLDLSGVLLSPILLFTWIHDLHNTSLFLSKSFLIQGFCESSLIPVHKYCAFFDWITGTLLFAKTNNIFSTLYMISHGYGHWEAQFSNKGPINTIGIVILSTLLSVGPFSSAKTLINKQICSPTTAYATATLALATSVTLFTQFLNSQHLALLYINLTLTFFTATPRLFLIGHSNNKDVNLRTNTPHFWGKILSGTAVLTIMFLEPTTCDNFLSSLGGHLLFDIALASQTFFETTI